MTHFARETHISPVRGQPRPYCRAHIDTFEAEFSKDRLFAVAFPIALYVVPYKHAVRPEFISTGESLWIDNTRSDDIRPDG